MFLCFCAKFQVSYIVIGREEKEEGWGGGRRYILGSVQSKQWITFHQVKHYVCKILHCKSTCNSEFILEQKDSQSART